MLLDMNVVVDVVLAIAVIPPALGAVPEFQPPVAHVRPATDCAFVGVWGLGLGYSGLVGPGGGKGMGLALGADFWRASSEKPPGVGPPAHGNDIQHVFSEEQEVIGQGHHREQIGREGIDEQAVDDQHQVQQGEDPGPHGDNEHQQELCVRVQGGVGQEQTHVQIVHVRLPAEKQTVNVHHYDARQIENVEFAYVLDVFHGPADGIIAQQADGGEQKATGVKGQGIGQQSPDLPVENAVPVKAQQVVRAHSSARWRWKDTPRRSPAPDRA